MGWLSFVLIAVRPERAFRGSSPRRSLASKTSVLIGGRHCA
jgi:hypothetical protein